MTIDAFLELLKPYGVKRSGNGWISRCPAHDDQTPSLSIHQNEHGDILLYCHAGCSVSAICKSLGITESDLFAARRHKPSNSRVKSKPKPAMSKPSGPPVDFTALSMGFEAALTDKLAAHHAIQLAVSVESLRHLHVGWDGQALTFPMKNAAGRVIGIKRRFPKGCKSSVTGSQNGIFIPDSFDPPKPCFLCEGPTDLLAALTLELNAIARSSCIDGVEQLCEFCRACEVVIVADADISGRRGAEHLADELARVCSSVRVIEPPKPHKDLRDWVRARATLHDLSLLAERAQKWRQRQEQLATTPTQKTQSSLAKLLKIQPWVSFPTSELPAPFDQYVVEAATSIRVDTSLVALPLLAAAAGAVGNARCAMVKYGWFEPCALWTACIKESGEGGTPAFKAGVDPLRNIDRQRHHEYQTQLADFIKKRDAHKGTVKAWKETGSIGAEPAEPLPPICTCHVVCDITTEALATILEENPRGVCYARDELSGFVRSHNEYKPKGGSDTANWLSMYSAEDIKIHRKTGESRRIFVRRAIVSITGTIQPGVLRRVMSRENRENGMLARFFLAWPPRKERGWADKTIDESTEQAVARVFERLTSLKPDLDEYGDIKPVIVRFSREAKALFVAYYNDSAGARADAVGDDAAAMSKLVGGAARLALVHHLVRVAADDPSVDPDTIDAVSMAAGISLARWFTREALRAYAALELEDNDDVREARQLVELIERRGGQITVRELQQYSRRFRGDPDAANEALQQLNDAGIGHWEEPAPGTTGGRPSRVFILDSLPDHESSVYETSDNDPNSGGIVDVDNADTIQTDDDTGKKSSASTDGAIENWSDPDPNSWAD